MDWTVFEVVTENKLYRIYWQDEQRRVCVIQALAQKWTWEDAYAAVQAVDATVRSVSHGVCVVYMFEPGRNLMPQGGGTISNLRRLISIYAPNTHLILFVRPDPSLRIFSEIVTKTFQLLGRNYVFVNSIDKAEGIISDYRSAGTVA